MDYPKSRASELGLYNGKFTSGIPGLRPASVDDAAFMNDLVDSILAVQAAAGQLPIEGDVSQLLKGVLRLIQKQVILDDAGSGPNIYSTSNSVPLSDGTLTRGLEQRFVVGHTNTGAGTYSPDGLGNKPILGLDLQPLKGGELIAGGIATLSYSPTANSGTGAWILLGCTGAPLAIPAGTQSNHAAIQGQLPFSGNIWKDMTGSRAVETTYTNSTGRWIALSLYTASSQAVGLNVIVNSLPVGSSLIQLAGGSFAASAFTLVPPGATYGVSNWVAGKWYELRP